MKEFKKEYNSAVNTNAQNVKILGVSKVSRESLLGNNVYTNFANTSSLKSNIIEGIGVENKTPLLISGNAMKQGNRFQFENPFSISSSALKLFNKYTARFNKTNNSIIAMYKGDKGSIDGIVMPTIHAPSLFSPYLSVSVCGLSSNIPVLNKTPDGKTIVAKNKLTNNTEISIRLNANPDITDCRTSTLCELSRVQSNSRTGWISKMGMARYQESDFLYCRDHGRISNNYMITLRRFSHPIGDNIFESAAVAHQSPDMGRLVCWINDDNKLENILNYSTKATWRELNSQIEEKSSEEDTQDRGILGSLVNIGNPQYRKAIKEGYAGSGNELLQEFESHFPAIFKSAGQYENHQILTNYDHNRVYEPKDTIQSTHIYEGKLQFSHEFTLVFDYELRAYENINPKAAFLDLLANINLVTYRHGNFWGGSRKINGAPPNADGWNKANLIIDNAWDKLGDFMGDLLSGNIDWSAQWAKLSDLFGEGMNMISGIIDTSKSVLNTMTGNGTAEDKEKATAAGKKVQDFIKNSGATSIVKGMLKNRLGRPAMYAWQSLLTGTNVGPWHVTIGNPRNPIMSMGNMIVEDTQITHYGPLGIDDFPTGLKVTVKLKHATPRDSVGIQRMYTTGERAVGMGIVGTGGAYEDFLRLTGLQTETVTINDPSGKVTDKTKTKKVTRPTKHNNIEVINRFGANDVQMTSVVGANAHEPTNMPS